jgi:hypothetical protein
MHAQKVTKTARNRIPVIIDRSDEEEILLKRWAASDGEFVDEELDWDDPLDAALGMELAGFRPGIDQYDA